MILFWTGGFLLAELDYDRGDEVVQFSVSDCRCMMVESENGS